MPTFFHYSPLFHLPVILADGLCFGEIAHHDLTRRQQAVSLTTQTDPDRLYCWGGDGQDQKKAVRYRCEIPADDPLLRPARDVWRKLKVQPRFLKILDPYGQSKWWYFYRVVIPRTRFRVQLLGRSGYVDVSEPDLERLAGEVAVVRDAFELETPPDRPWDLLVRLKNPQDETPLWLYHETHPAERYLLPRAP
jgi:hypothetical protein